MAGRVNSNRYFPRRVIAAPRISRNLRLGIGIKPHGSSKSPQTREIPMGRASGSREFAGSEDSASTRIAECRHLDLFCPDESGGHLVDVPVQPGFRLFAARENLQPLGISRPISEHPDYAINRRVRCHKRQPPVRPVVLLPENQRQPQHVVRTQIERRPAEIDQTVIIR